MSNLNLKGIWIPIEILIDDNLSDKEKLIYSIILFLSKENNYCYCNNSSLSELLNISTTQVSKLINSLKKKECIDIIIKYKENSKEIESRKLIPKKEIPYLTKVKYPPQQNFNTPIEEKFKDNKYNNKINNKYNSENNFAKRNKANFEQRDYTGIDLTSLYANGCRVSLPHKTLFCNSIKKCCSVLQHNSRKSKNRKI